MKHTYTLDGTNILRETWSGNTLIPLYDNEDSVCGILYDDIPYYFLKNLQGDIIAITNHYGDVLARYSYDAWGVCTITSDSSNCAIATINPFRYRGYHWRVDKGLAMNMSMNLVYRGSTIINYSEKTWWITGFNPNPKYFDVKASELKVYFEVSFGKESLYNSFKNTHANKGTWTFPRKPIAKYTF